MMFMQLISINLMLSFIGIFSMQCAANPFSRSALPKQMPAEVEMRFSENGGMTRAGTSILVSRNLLKFEELKASERDPTRWSAQISSEEAENLYAVFVANNFDLIKNDMHFGTVYDAGSQGIFLSLSEDKYYQISYGANSPLSGSSLKHYQAVSDAIHALVSRYESKRNSNQD